MSRLSIEGLVVAYDGDPVVRDLDLVVEDGRIAAILGPSGCGKTTLLRTIAGFLRPVRGTLALDDRIVAGPSWVPPERRGVGIVPQEGALFPHLDVRRNIAFGLPRGAAADDRVDELLDLIGLPGAGRLRPSELSGGMQQRVALARALAPEPDLILLDEPFSALDAGLRASLRHEVRALLQRTRTTAILVTHDQEEALSFADQVAVMREGRIVQSASPDTVYARPADLQVARFVGQLVELQGEAARGTVRTALGEHLVVDPALSGACVVALRPEQIDLHPAGGPGAPGVVAGITFHGHDHLVEVRLEDGSLVSVRQAGAPRQHVDDTVTCSVHGTVSAFPALADQAALANEH
jgi:iron(III) transport system ATP-binding protein